MQPLLAFAEILVNDGLALEPTTGIKAGYFLLLLPLLLFLFLVLVALTTHHWVQPQVVSLLRSRSTNRVFFSLELVLTTLAGMSANAPAYKAIFNGSVELSDLLFLCGIVVFGFTAGWLAIIQRRTLSEVEELVVCQLWIDELWYFVG